MANGNGEISLDVMPHSEEKATSGVHSVQKNVLQLWTKAVTEQKSATEDEGHRTKSGAWPAVRKYLRGLYEQHRDQQILLDPPRRFLLEWNNIFLISCVFAVSLDPLFFYIPIINEDMKCLRLDKRLMAISFGLRSLTDLFYIADIMSRILSTKPNVETTGFSPMVTKTEEAVSSKASKSVDMDVLEIAKRAFAVAKRILQSYILLDILAILPVPQVVVFIFISKMRGLRSLKTRKFLNSLLLLQYVPRVFCIYLLSNKRRKTAKKTGLWVKSFFNFFLYILASHVIGALWYFFAVQREAACWQYACRSENGCEPTTFNCDDTSFRKITFLNDLCPINPPNVTLFDFGIFLDALQSGILQSTDFPDKFLNCFWWGLRNLSSLGQNLKTSTYAWENLFAVFISIIGLLLFLYLIGNLQTYMQLSTTTSEKLRRKMKMKGLEVELWLSENGLPKTMKTRIMENVLRKLEENKNVHVEILSVLPSDYLSCVKRCLCLATLWKVPKLKDIEGQDELKGICEHFKPVIYAKDNFIIREREPLDMILLITQGSARTYTTSNGGKEYCPRPKVLKKGDFYGEELITWTSKFPPSTDLPVSDRNVRSITRVEAFALSAEDLKNHVVLRYFWWQFTKDMKFDHLSITQRQLLEELAGKSLLRAFRRRQKTKKHAVCFPIGSITKHKTI